MNYPFDSSWVILLLLKLVSSFTQSIVLDVDGEFWGGVDLENFWNPLP